MNNNERIYIGILLIIIAVLVGADVYTDAQEGVAIWHILFEAAIGLSALVGVFYLLKGTFALKRSLQNEKEDFSNYKKQAEAWRAESKKYIQGLSEAIDQQLSVWNLSRAEKEVAFLLLKGLSLKEIAEIRNTSEKTARAQSLAIYSKAGLSGRSELAAFFLEDLLLPSTQ